jgi:hypothetical protein
MLLDDLAALHSRFQGAITAGPLRVGARALIARHASFGAWRRVELPGALAEILDNPEPLVAILDSQPSTLVHGDAYPANVIRGAGPRRVWIDWEDALIGSAAIDLAAFYGSGPWFLGRSLDRERCLARYSDSLRVPNFELDRSFDAAVVLWTVSQDLGALKKERGRHALEAFVQERVDALDRLAL